MMRRPKGQTALPLRRLAVRGAREHSAARAPVAAPVLDMANVAQLGVVPSAYQGPALAAAFALHGVRIEVVRRSDGQPGFVVLARGSVVERTLSRLSRSRRLNRDHERRPDHHAQMMLVGSQDQAVTPPGRRCPALAGEAPRPTTPVAVITPPRQSPTLLCGCGGSSRL